MNDIDFIPFESLHENYKEIELTKEQLDYINRGSFDYEPIDLQLRN